MLLYVLWSYFYLKQSFYYHTGPLEVAISGGVAGACFWSSVFPTDVVKSRVQTGSNNSGYPKGFLSLTYTIFKREGIRALYKVKQSCVSLNCLSIHSWKNAD
ncbi:mitochondrial ornithine transporter 1 [Paramuricea clavata]|uniref:Mitochondrial ornithine transporter 1 n=1 Tax=Paramuricea clavata TaxID=317549 RepID=A0A6S7JD88_PARCT|nr:mitochondrial ornithine transporter 1 [Paramuricea clavata]